MHFATEFWLTRLCFQHALGGIYLIAFLIAANQFIPLLGERGLQPVRLIVWVLFRTMFGAGMIKVRADPCWHDLTCLFYHYETQPLPNPLSWYLHHAPRWFHKAGVLFNHFTELIVPWFYFAPAPLCYWAGAITILFQITLILSGNLSWLNYITIVLCIPCFDDHFLGRVLSLPHFLPAHLTVSHAIVVIFVTTIVFALSWR